MLSTVIFGLGDYARVASVYLERDSPYSVVAFTAHQQYITDSHLLGYSVVPFEHILETHPPTQYTMLVAMGPREMNDARAQVYQTCKEMGYSFVTYISSSASIWGDVEIGENTFIFEENVIQPFVKIGNNTVLWSGNHIGHDSTIGDNVFMASHVVVSGNVTIGNNCFVGVNATFVDKITVSPYTLVGAGSLITRSIDDPATTYTGARAEKSSRSSREFKL